MVTVYLIVWYEIHPVFLSSDLGITDVSVLGSGPDERRCEDRITNSVLIKPKRQCTTSWIGLLMGTRDNQSVTQRLW